MAMAPKNQPQGISRHQGLARPILLWPEDALQLSCSPVGSTSQRVTYLCVIEMKINHTPRVSLVMLVARPPQRQVPPDVDASFLS